MILVLGQCKTIRNAHMIQLKWMEASYLFTLLNSREVVVAVRRGFLAYRYIPIPMVPSNLSVPFLCNLSGQQKPQILVSAFDPNPPSSVGQAPVTSVASARPCSAFYSEHLRRQCAIRRTKTSSWTTGAARPNGEG